MIFQLLMQLVVYLQISHPRLKWCNKSGLIFLLQRKYMASSMSLPRAMTGRAHWPTGNCSLQHTKHCAKRCLDNLSKAISAELFYTRLVLNLLILSMHSGSTSRFYIISWHLTKFCLSSTVSHRQARANTVKCIHFTYNAVMCFCYSLSCWRGCSNLHIICVSNSYIPMFILWGCAAAVAVITSAILSPTIMFMYKLSSQIHFVTNRIILW